MTAILFALTSAAGYGVSDFVAGISSRHRSAWAVAVAAQFVAGLVVLLVAVGRLGDPSPVDLAWGAVAGLGNAVGSGFLYRGLGSGRMSVVTPVAAVGAALVPVTAGLLVGERPSLLVWAGIFAALPGIWFVSRVVDHAVESTGQSARGRDGGRAPARVGTPLRDGMLAGLGLGVVLAALGQIPESAGLLPLLVDQAVAVVGIVGLAVLSREQWWPRGVAVWGGGAAGALGGLATVAFLLSSQSGPLTVVAVLTSLHPAVTILLAAAVLSERIHRWQGVGLVLCGLAVALVGSG
ncbi:MAG: DMT family transporter [Micrococcales bacterium]|nr:DMT family transporter [Micrococcales bacterium]